MRPLRIWQLNMKNIKKKSIAEKIARETHTSTRDIIKNFKYYTQILKNNLITNQLKLDEEEIEYINNLI